MLVDALDVVPLGSRRSGEWMDSAHELSHLRINVCHSLTYGVVLQVAMPRLDNTSMYVTEAVWPAHVSHVNSPEVLR